MRTTFIQLPHNLEDPVVLRRFLDKLVQQIDVAFNLRGEGGFASTDMATRLNRDTNSKFTGYMKADGSNIQNTISYPSEVTIADPKDITHKGYVDSQKLQSAPAPATLTGAVSNDQLRDTLNELINTLKTNGVLA